MVGGFFFPGEPLLVYFLIFPSGLEMGCLLSNSFEPDHRGREQ
jgi:hypothetical protein